MKRTSSISVLLALLGLTGCPSDDVAPTDTDDPTGTSTGEATDNPTTGEPTTTGVTTGLDSSSGDETPPMTDDGSSSSGEPPPPPMAAEFSVTIENVSNTGLMFTPLSPGVWANHEANADVLFEQNVPDDGEGLEALAEDGDPTALEVAVATHADVSQTGVFDTPVDGKGPGPLLPGETYEFTFTAEPGSRLSLATMLVGSNDLFVASSPTGIGLFSGGGQPMNERDVSSSLRIWDAGTEYDQAPGQGPMQALHGGGGNMGPSEGAGVNPYNHSTRAIPLGPDFVAVDFATDMTDPKNPGLTVTLTNISDTRGTLVSPLTPAVWATHTDAIAFFEAGTAASAELESLAEDGDPAALDAALDAAAEVGEHAIAFGEGGEGTPLLPGESTSFTFIPSPDFPMLSIASMVAASNDAFLGTGVVGDAASAGIPLYDDDGTLHSNDDLEDMVRAHFAVYDAGTEANEVAGVGANQPGRQDAPNTGPSDLDEGTVERYADVTNDLAGEGAGGFATVTVTELLGEYTITFTNSSALTAFPGVLTPTLWAVHDDTVGLFEVGAEASPGLELLAEDGDATGLLGELVGMAGFGAAGVESVPFGAVEAAPLFPGDSYTITVTPDAVNRFLSLATMIVPSNDTFAALGPAGVALIDADGTPRLALDVQADINAALAAWDAGTEGNQAGAAGRDMAPVGAPNTGPGNGNGLVRRTNEDADIWHLPEAQDVIRVIVAPTGN